MIFYNFIKLLLILLININLINSEIFEECNGVDDETFVASKSDCRTYIYCTGEDSLSGECDEGQYFDPDASACDDAANVYCALDELNTEAENSITDTELTADAAITTTENILVTEPQAVATTAITESPTNLDTTMNVIITTTTTMTTTRATTKKIPIETTTTQPPITTSTQASLENSNNYEIIDKAPIVRENCPPNDNPNQIVLMANNKSCSDYYICYYGNAIEMHCTSHLHFNKATGVCDYPENVQCMESVSIAHKCLPHVTGFFPHAENCNYFYYCIRGFLTVQQCPFFYGWDIEKRACVQISKAKCYNNSNNISNVKKNNINYF